MHFSKVTLPTRWCLHTHSWVLTKCPYEVRWALAPRGVGCLHHLWPLDSTPEWRPVHRVSVGDQEPVLGVVCLCPEVRLLGACRDGRPVDRLCASNSLGWGCSGCGQTPCFLDRFSLWCVLCQPSSLRRGRTSYLAEGTGGKGAKEPFLLFWFWITQA